MEDVKQSVSTSLFQHMFDVYVLVGFEALITYINLVFDAMF